MVHALVAQKRGDIENAKRILQTALLHASNQVQACLMRLASAPFAEAEEERSIARVYQACSEAIGYPFSMSDMLFMEAYLRLGDKKHAAEHLRRLAAALSDPPEAPLSALLFSTFSKDVSQTGRLFPACGAPLKNFLQRMQSLPLCGICRNTKRRLRCFPHRNHPKRRLKRKTVLWSVKGPSEPKRRGWPFVFAQEAVRAIS